MEYITCTYMYILDDILHIKDVLIDEDVLYICTD